MIPFDEWNAGLTNLLPRTVVQLDISTEEVVDALNHSRHAFSLWIGDILPYWGSGIVRCDAFTTVSRSLLSENVRRYDGTGFTQAMWLDVQMPASVRVLYAVNTFNGKRWYAARPTSALYSTGYTAHWLTTPEQFQPLFTFYVETQSGIPWTSVTTGAAAPSPERVEVWYGRAYDYLDIGDNDVEAPEWGYGITLIGAWLKLIAKHLAGMSGLDIFAEYLRTVTSLYQRTWVVQQYRLKQWSAYYQTLRERKVPLETSR